MHSDDYSVGAVGVTERRRHRQWSIPDLGRILDYGIDDYVGDADSVVVAVADSVDVGGLHRRHPRHCFRHLPSHAASLSTSCCRQH